MTNEPRVIWGDDGWAETDGWAHAHCTDPQSSELILSHDVWVSRGCGLPANAYLDDPMAAEPGKAIVRHNDAWAQVDDYRGQTAYDKQTRESTVIEALDDLPVDKTLTPPESAFDEWNKEQSCWVKNDSAENAWQLQQAETKRDELMAEANQHIDILADAVELGMATPDEQVAYTAWRQYRVRLSRLDMAQQPVEWPPKPDKVI